MRGRYIKVDKMEVLEYYETHSLKETAAHFNLPLTTLCSKFENWNLSPYKPVNHIELTEESIAYIKEHTINEVSKHFRVEIPRVRKFIHTYGLIYAKRTDRRLKPLEPKTELQNKMIEMHKTMNYEEIGKELGYSKARVSQIIRTGF